MHALVLTNPAVRVAHCGAGAHACMLNCSLQVCMYTKRVGPSLWTAGRVYASMPAKLVRHEPAVQSEWASMHACQRGPLKACRHAGKHAHAGCAHMHADGVPR